MNKELIKKISKIFGNVVMVVFLVICVAALVVTVGGRKDRDGATEIFGYQMRVVVSDSMGKCDQTDVSAYKIKSIPINSMVFVQTVPDDPAEAKEWYDNIKVGDVLTFRYVYTNQVTITHRVVDIEPKADGGYLIYLEGDNKVSSSNLLEQVIDTSETNSTNYVIGKVVGQSYLFGLFMSIIKKPIGTICIVIVPCFIIILLEVLKIVGVVNEDKKKKEQDEKEQKDNELEELRRKLAELEGMKSEAKPEPVAEQTADEQAEVKTEEKSDVSTPATESEE